ncbi:OppA family ABC transporter substrate-binding lipoprotein [Mycoplasma elephantis]|uniref:OppA family ABC transporter substrate-binding lipoprotein n=1 Tax=Mycoplasma elephantis TaxID=114882 RepID=UPI000485B646|nr:hypothetical protein [Mycoplasma elephantis]
MFKKRHLFIALASIPALLASTCVISCNNNDNENIINRRNTLITRYNASRTIEPFFYDFSASYGSMTAGHENTYLSGNFIRYARSGETKITKTPKQVGGAVVYDFKVEKPTLEWLQLDLSSEILLTLWDGTKKYYTNSKHEVTPKWDEKQQVLKLSSKDEKSVNNPQFIKDLEKAKSVQFIIRDVNWTDSNNKETKYKLIADDFYYSWMRTQLLSIKNRIKNGAKDVISEELKNGKKTYVDEIGKLYRGAKTHFSDTSYYPNGYLLELFGVDLEGLDDYNKTVVEVENSQGQKVKAFTFNASPSLIKQNEGKTGAEVQNAKFVDYLKTLCNELVFSPAPSQYIKEVAEANNEEQTVDDNDIKEKLKSLTGDVKKYGYYWYGNKREQLLYVSPFIPNGYNSETNTETYTQNKYYWDQGWVNSKNSIKKIQNEYKAAPIDGKEFNDSQFNAFKAGLIDSISYDSLSQSNKDKVDAGIPEFPIQYKQSLNKNHRLYQLLENIIPVSDPENTNNYSFNTNYAKMIFGYSLDDIKKGVNSDNKDVATASSFVKGYGKSFRSLVANTINMYAFTAFISNNQNQPLLSGIALDSPWFTNTEKTPRENLYEINETYVFDKDGNKLNLSNTTDPKYAITHKDLENFDIHQKTEDKLRTPFYEKIQKAMKELLDEFYAKNSLANTDKIKWTQCYRYTNPDDKTRQAMDTYKKLVNSLDPRLEFDIIYPKDGKELQQQVVYGTGLKEFNGWGYDYEAQGSYYTGLTASTSTSLLYVLSTILKEEGNLQTQLPTLTKLAKLLDKKLSVVPNSNYFIPFELKYYSDIPNKFLISNSVNELYRDSNGTIRLLDEKNADDKAILDARKNVGEFNTVLAKIFLDLQGELTVEEHIELIKEINSVYIWDFGTNLQTAIRPRPVIQTNKYIAPNSSSSVPYYQDLVLVNK